MSQRTRDSAVIAKPGDWVVGHDAVYFILCFAVPGKITHVSQTGRTVRFKPSIGARVLTGYDREMTITYRPRIERWLERGTRHKKTVDGLCRLIPAQRGRAA